MTKYRLLSDFELFALFKSGDRNAFAEIYERYFGLLYLHAANRLKEKDEAKDLVQELFFNLWTSGSSLQLKTNLSNYLYTCVKNAVLNVIAHKHVEQKYIQAIDLDTQVEACTDYWVREKQLADIIEKEIDALPPRMKQVFLLSRKANMTYIEIAERLDLTEQSVRSHVKNALRVLRVKLGTLLHLFTFLF